MATDVDIPKRQITPVATPAFAAPTASSLPQKRALEDDHAPSISSPLKPNLTSSALDTPKLNKTQSQDDVAAMARDKPARTKKESLKKRESKGGAESSSRATPDPTKLREKDANLPPSEASPLRYKLAPPKPSDFEPARPPVFTYHHAVPTLDGSALEVFETSEHVYNKKSFHYLHCIADPNFPSSFYYRQTEPEPYGAHISFEDAGAHMYLDRSARHITTDKGFRMARANVAVRQGRWYWECRITRGTTTAKSTDGVGGVENSGSHGHVRMGFARREASLDAPVGFDAYSYGLRDVAGQKVHMSRPKDFFPPGEDIREGDVIGLEIQLPSEQLHRKVVQGRYNPAVDLIAEEEPSAEATNIVRDRIPIRFKAHIYFEKIDYHASKELEDLMNPSPAAAGGAPSTAITSGRAATTEQPNPNHQAPALRTLPKSHIKVYKNGVLMGTPFTDLLAFLPPASKPQAQVGAREGMDDGMLGYYPAVSVFRGGAAEVNFGPDFWCPPLGYNDADDENKKKGNVSNAEQADDVEDNDDVDMIDAGNTNADTETDTVRVATPATTSNSNTLSGELDALRPVAERYDEQIVEDIVADLIDEVDFWMQDGGRVVVGSRDYSNYGKAETDMDMMMTGIVGGDGDGDGADDGMMMSMMAPARGGEIKELVQDD